MDGMARGAALRHDGEDLVGPEPGADGAEPPNLQLADYKAMFRLGGLAFGALSELRLAPIRPRTRPLEPLAQELVVRRSCGDRPAPPRDQVLGERLERPRGRRDRRQPQLRERAKGLGGPVPARHRLVVDELQQVGRLGPVGPALGPDEVLAVLVAWKQYWLTPQGITKLMDMTLEREEIQKFVVIEGAFDRPSTKMRQEISADGGIIVQVYLREIIGLLYIPALLKLRKGSGRAVSRQKAANLLCGLETVALLLASSPSVERGKDANVIDNQTLLARGIPGGHACQHIYTSSTKTSFICSDLLLFYINRCTAGADWQVLSILLEVSSSRLASPEELLPLIMRHLAVSPSGGDAWLHPVLPRLLTTWLADCPRAVSTSLGQPQHLPYLVELTGTRAKLRKGSQVSMVMPCRAEYAVFHTNDSPGNCLSRASHPIQCAGSLQWEPGKHTRCRLGSSPSIDTCVIFNESAAVGATDAATVVNIINQRVGLSTYFGRW
eukprot:SM000011S19002  [mRNA]  locus=s11:254178:257544:- [translate_table: standard]